MEHTGHTTTLLVIDVQESVLAGCADVEGVVGRINELARRARSTGSPVVYLQHQDPGDPELTAGSPGWQLAADLERLGEDPVIAKSYRDGFAQTALDATLAASGTRRVAVTGAHSDYCVQTTALSALAHGYDLTVASDAHTAQAAELPEAKIPAATVVAFINDRFAGLRYPGRVIEVLPTAKVTF
ncbi:MAG TPA: isochorismatase family protein [Trebonia sp.]|jgi:nicotinamidase-related amidase|nr:isochorismatase family protein [Trebonia sp.]